MKSFRFISIVLLIVLFFSSCNITKSEKEYQELKNNVITYNQEEMFRISLSEAGLEDVFIQHATGFEKIDNESDWCQVFLLGNDRFEQSKPCDYYLAVLCYDKVYLKEAAICSHGSGIELCDFDGDGDKEILLQETVGMSGGAGQYSSSVLDFENGEFIEMFSDSVALYNGDNKTTGFSIEILKGNKYKIKNSITDYSEIFDFKNKPEKYLNSLYDENGEVIKRKIYVDSFFDFIPNDVDNDGVYEIVCRQYVSLIDHSDHLGNAKTILKFNNKTASFEIIDAEFEPYEE